MTNLLNDISWVVGLRSETLTPIFQVFTALGYPNLMMLILALAYWFWSKPAATRLMFIVVFSTLLNAFLKDYWENPRPDAMFRLDGEVGSSFGMPSGHAQVSAVLWFFIAYEVRRLWAWCFAAVVVTGICMSRLYLGVHDLEDILVGLLLAIVSLSVYVQALNSDFLKNVTPSFWVQLAVFVIFGVALRLAWPQAENSAGAIVVVALPVTWLLGRRLAKYLDLHNDLALRFSLLKRIASSIIGVVALLGLMSLMKSVTSSLDPDVSSLFITGALGLHVTMIAPLLFKLCKLTSS